MNHSLKILVVNDDGIRAEGIARLARAAAQFGMVYVAAPSQQCSGMSQRLNITEAFPVTEISDFPAPVEAAFSIGSTPADCVKVALDVLLDFQPDFVFSGINFGYNTGFDLAYSGTVGAAQEAVMNGIPALAFSCQHDGTYDVTDTYLVPIIEELLSSPLAPGEFWNVNFPGCPLSTFGGIARGTVPERKYVVQNRYRRSLAPDGTMLLKSYMELLDVAETTEGTDVNAVLNGRISISKVKSALF